MTGKKNAVGDAKKHAEGDDDPAYGKRKGILRSLSFQVSSCHARPCLGARTLVRFLRDSYSVVSFLYFEQPTLKPSSHPIFENSRRSKKVTWLRLVDGIPTGTFAFFQLLGASAQ